MIEDDTYVVKGFSPLEVVADVPLGKLIYNQLLTHCNEDTAMVS
jgi:hypothetical protein